MRDVRGSWKRPVWSAGYRAQRWKFSPVLPKVFAAEEVGRLRAGINPNFAVRDGRSQAVNVMNREAIVTPFPGFAAVRAGMNRTKERSGKHQATGPLEDNRTNMLAAQRAMRLAPFGIVGALEQDQAIFGPDP